jgi:hypothetical protein
MKLEGGLPVDDPIERYRKEVNTDLSAYDGDKRAIASHMQNMQTSLTVTHLAAPCGAVFKRGTGSSVFGSTGWRRRFVILAQGCAESYTEVSDFMEGKAPRKAPLSLRDYSVESAPSSVSGLTEVTASRPGYKTLALRVPSSLAPVWVSGLQLAVSEAALCEEMDEAFYKAGAGAPEPWEGASGDGEGDSMPFSSFVGVSSDGDARARRALVEDLTRRLGPSSAFARRSNVSNGQILRNIWLSSKEPAGAAESAFYEALAETDAAALLIGQTITTDFECEMDPEAARNTTLALLNMVALASRGRDAILRAGALQAFAQRSLLATCTESAFESICSIVMRTGPVLSKSPMPAAADSRAGLSVGAFVRLALTLAGEAETRKTAGLRWASSAVHACLVGSGAPAQACAAFSRAKGFATLLRARRLLFLNAVRGEQDALEVGPSFDDGLRFILWGVFKRDCVSDSYKIPVSSTTSKFSAVMHRSLLPERFGGSGTTIRAVEVGSDKAQLKWREKEVDPGSVYVSYEVRLI